MLPFSRTSLITTALGTALAAQAAPFAITTTGTIDRSNFAEIRNGERYAITLIYDNGQDTANGQTWQQADLRCAVWRMNNTADVTYTQTRFNATSATGTPTTTHAVGVLTHVQEGFSQPAGATDAYTSSGLGLTTGAQWQMDNVPGSGKNQFGDGAVRSFAQLDFGPRAVRWSQPRPANASDPCGTPPPLLMPGVPRELRAVPGNQTVTVHWEVPDGPAPLTYAVAAHSSLAGASRFCAVDHPATSCTLEQMVNDETYTILVNAYNIDGDHSAETAVQATPSEDPAPTTPTQVRATPGDGEATIRWRAWQPDLGGTPPARYSVYQEGQGEICALDASEPAQCTVTGLTNGTTYAFHVLAISASDRASGRSANTYVVPGWLAPQAPRNLTAIAGNGKVVLNWDASAGGAEPSGYMVTTQPGGKTCTPTPPTGTTCTVTGLSNGTTYTFTVAARNANGVSEASGPARATPRSENPASGPQPVPLLGAPAIALLAIAAAALGAGRLRRRE